MMNEKCFRTHKHELHLETPGCAAEYSLKRGRSLNGMLRS